MSKSKVVEIKKLVGYLGNESYFTKVNDNAWVECTANGKPVYDRGEVEIAKFFGGEFPKLEIRVTIGAWRTYDIAAKFNSEHTIIFIDIYSVGVPKVKSSWTTSLVTNAHRILNKNREKPKTIDDEVQQQ